MSENQNTFAATVTDFYRTSGRHTLPWRNTKNPYRILLSEMMLQQTQVDRVIPKYHAFIEQFPTVQSLAGASLGEVLIAWQGLGYNRRAKMLHSCAQEVVLRYKGVFPKTFTKLVSLPGIGPYTAGAVMAFAYNQPVPIIETNIRAVFIHHFFKNKDTVLDADIIALVEKTLDSKNPREWYWALMDYGSFIKKEFGNPNSKSKHYIKQSKFEGSDRQIRGAILRELVHQKKMTRISILKLLSSFEDIRVDAQLFSLEEEGMITRKGKSYSLPA